MENFKKQADSRRGALPDTFKSFFNDTL